MTDRDSHNTTKRAANGLRACVSERCCQHAMVTWVGSVLLVVCTSTWLGSVHTAECIAHVVENETSVGVWRHVGFMDAVWQRWHSTARESAFAPRRATAQRPAKAHSQRAPRSCAPAPVASKNWSD